MKFLIATVSVSLVLPCIPLSNYGQAAGGGSAAGGGVASRGAGGVTSRGSAVIRGSATASGATAAPTGRIAPAGVPQASIAGRTLSSPATGQLVTGGHTIAPSAAAGPVNPGQITAVPPYVVGRTFDRVPIVGAPTDTVIDPAAPQPTFRFPPASTLPQSVVENTGIGGQFDSGLPEAATFPRGNPVGVGNTVGIDFGNVQAVAPEPVVINLPPGARIVRNASGVAEVGVAPVAAVTPTIVPNTGTGLGPTFESSSSRSSTQPVQPSPAPRNAPIVPR